MTDRGAERIEQYQYLHGEAKKNMRWFTFAVVGFVACLLLAFTQGAGAGWPWLLGAQLFMFGGLWSLIEARYFDLRVMFHVLPDDLRKVP
jgi:hypothetical protein